MPYPVDKLCLLSKSIWSLPSYPSNPHHFKQYSNIHTSSYSAIPHTSPCPQSLLSAPDPIPRWAAISNLLLDFFLTSAPLPLIAAPFLRNHIYKIINTNLTAHFFSLSHLCLCVPELYSSPFFVLCTLWHTQCSYHSLLSFKWRRYCFRNAFLSLRLETY